MKPITKINTHLPYGQSSIVRIMLYPKSGLPYHVSLSRKYRDENPIVIKKKKKWWRWFISSVKIARKVSRPSALAHSVFDEIADWSWLRTYERNDTNQVVHASSRGTDAC
ncbi:hypothetical protein TNCV_2236931 [Trichonephila clavipes]|nr:hypothetical protein TNCV_2236931 [Trichonephila clavipes]